ncbi:MAG TPA: isoprenylcysteine carboxylmethyltransferase family protein [Opitutaceae bacterium]|nr:isoprenylcysteine carboxylmethyltransferase family protein [Opitutaceae bacterium]
MSYRVFIAILWLGAVAYWVFSARGNKRTVYRSNPVWRMLSGIGIVGLFVLFDAFPEFFHKHVYVATQAGEAAGIMTCAAGLALAIWARHTLGRNWSGTPTIKEGHELVENGPYRLVRHPIYTGILVAVAGTGIGSGQVKHLFILGAALALLWAKLRIEEGLMLRQFPHAYPGYMKRTKALIPFVV